MIAAEAEQDMLKPEDIAVKLGISRGQVYKLANSGVLPCVKLGSLIKFPRVAWEKWLAGQSEAALAAAQADVRSNGAA